MFSSTLYIFKDRNTVADRSEKLIYDDSMNEIARAATRRTPILSSSSEQAPMRLRCKVR